MAFAKIIQSEKFDQVLLTIMQDDEVYELKHTIEINGVYASVKLSVSDENRAKQYFEEFDEETADKLFSTQLQGLF